MRQHHGIKVGDLVKFKHHMFDEAGTIHLVIRVWEPPSLLEAESTRLKLHGGNDIEHRASNFITVSRN